MPNELDMWGKMKLPSRPRMLFKVFYFLISSICFFYPL